MWYTSNFKTTYITSNKNGNQLILASTSSNVLPGRGSKKAFNEWLWGEMPLSTLSSESILGYLLSIGVKYVIVVLVNWDPLVSFTPLPKAATALHKISELRVFSSYTMTVDKEPNGGLIRPHGLLP